MTRSIIPIEAKQTRTVALWTPWGVQSVPKQDAKTNAVQRRLVSRPGGTTKPQTRSSLQA